MARRTGERGRTGKARRGGRRVACLSPSSGCRRGSEAAAEAESGGVESWRGGTGERRPMREEEAAALTWLVWGPRVSDTRLPLTSTMEEPLLEFTIFFLSFRLQISQTVYLQTINYLLIKLLYTCF